MKNCPNCNSINTDESNVCATCGAQLEAQTAAPQFQQSAAPQYQSAAPHYNQTAPQYQPSAPRYNNPPVGFQPQPQQYQSIDENLLPVEYRPVSTGSYIGHSFLFGLPVIGLIMLFVIGFGSSNSKSLRNFAKAQLIFRLLAFIFVIVAIVFPILLAESL